MRKTWRTNGRREREKEGKAAWDRSDQVASSGLPFPAHSSPPLHPPPIHNPPPSRNPILPSPLSLAASPSPPNPPKLNKMSRNSSSYRRFVTSRRTTMRRSCQVRGHRSYHPWRAWAVFALIGFISRISHTAF